MTEKDIELLRTMSAEFTRDLQHKEAVHAIYLEAQADLHKIRDALGTQLNLHGYVVKDGPCKGGSFVSKSYAVHPEYLEAFDKGLYDFNTKTWHPSVGEVPEHAVLVLLP